MGIIAIGFEEAAVMLSKGVSEVNIQTRLGTAIESPMVFCSASDEGE